MATFTYRISDPMGLHARPAGMMVKIISQQGSTVKLNFNGKEADGRRLYQVLSLWAKTGDEIKFTIEGDKADEMKELLLSLFKSEKL